MLKAETPRLAKETFQNTLPRKKVVIVGDGACGKTSLLMVRCNQYYPEIYVPTVFENYSTIVNIDNTSVDLWLWDTCGQEDYDRLRPLNYPDTDLLLLAFDIGSPTSYWNVLDKWYPETRHFLLDIPSILVGLKKDMRNDKKKIADLEAQGTKPLTEEDGRYMLSRVNAKYYFECSAKNDDGVDQVFEAAAKLVLKTSMARHRARAPKKCNLL